MKSVLVTFEPHTRLVLNPDQPFKLLTTLREKAWLIEKMGIDFFAVVPFTAELSRQTPEQFISSILVERLHAAEWVMGKGHGVGRAAGGSKNILHNVLSKYHIISFTADLLKQADTVVSSTRIRVNISKGHIVEAIGMLGHPYLITTTRVEGVKVGSQLGFPTLNFLRPSSQKVLPPPGVYAAELEYKGQLKAGALYFGDCPTFKNRTVHFEFHALSNRENFPDVGTEARLLLYKFLRKDRFFPSFEELVTQIKHDIEIIEIFFKEKAHATNQ
jgi:riboflavin kinase/FMN adenylyltransferase